MEKCVSYKLTSHEANKLKWQNMLDRRTSESLYIKLQEFVLKFKHLPEALR